MRRFLLFLALFAASPAAAVTLTSGTFTGTGQSAAVGVQPGAFNVSQWGTFAATVQLERSFDNGVTWLPITANGTQLELFTAPVSEIWVEPEAGVLYRLNDTAYTSGTVNYRISQ
jgi:hypothetical protein